MQSETARLGICLLYTPNYLRGAAFWHAAQESYNPVVGVRGLWGQVFTQNSVLLSQVMCPVDYH